jgi:triosephosphate isomerase
MSKRKFVAGNWKMNGLSNDLAEIAAIAEQAGQYAQVDVALCLPASLIHRAAQAVPGLSIGGQDVHQSQAGAHTGCTSAAMLKDAGAKLAIVGHSERREEQKESDAAVGAKAAAALAGGLDVILCVGESLAVRECGQAVATVVAQLQNSVPPPSATGRLDIAYEPIWAIGTGKIPTISEIGEMHRAIRQCLDARGGDDAAAMRILYGGSVKASNAAEIFAVENVDGALVGGASLTAADFIPIVAAAAAGDG